MQDTNRLIAEYIEQGPSRPGKYDARLKTYGVPVWALIGDLRMLGWDIEQTAQAYDIPKEAVEAARAYYEKYTDLIDARIDANNAPAEHEVPVIFDAP